MGSSNTARPAPGVLQLQQEQGKRERGDFCFNICLSLSEKLRKELGNMEAKPGLMEKSSSTTGASRTPTSQLSTKGTPRVMMPVGSVLWEPRREALHGASLCWRWSFPPQLQNLLVSPSQTGSVTTCKQCQQQQGEQQHTPSPEGSTGP